MADYTHPAVRAVLQAARNEHSFAEWLAQVLAQVAGQLGSSDALIAGRPGSWEADLVDRLVKGTVGYGDEYLPGPIARLTDAQVREIREAGTADAVSGVTHEELGAEYGVAPSTISDIVHERTWAWLQ